MFRSCARPHSCQYASIRSAGVAHAGERKGHIVSETAKDARVGKLVCKLMVAFVLFALVAIALSAAFIYTSVRSTYLDTQADRLAQLADHAGASASQNGYDAGDDLPAWLEMDDIIGRDVSYNEFVAEQQEAIDAYNSLVERYNAAEEAGDASTTAADGTYEELMERGGLFASLVARQQA